MCISLKKQRHLGVLGAIFLVNRVGLIVRWVSLSFERFQVSLFLKTLWCVRFLVGLRST